MTDNPPHKKQKITHGINVQHNCIDGGCKTVQANVPRHNRQEDSSTSYFVVHSSKNSYIINGFSHQSAMYHRAHSKITIPPISDSMFEEAIHQGKQVWQKEDISKGKQEHPSSPEDTVTPTSTTPKDEQDKLPNHWEPTLLPSGYNSEQAVQGIHFNPPRELHYTDPLSHQNTHTISTPKQAAYI